MQTDNTKIEEIRSRNLKSDNFKSVVEQRGRKFNVSNIFHKVYSSIEWLEDVYILVCEEEVQEQIQSQMGSRCSQENRLDDEVYELWNLIKFFKKIYSKVKQVTHCEIGLKMKNSEGKNSGSLQHKVWKPERLQPIRNDDSKAHRQLQKKVWDPRGL